jgi:hypothetical protein
MELVYVYAMAAVIVGLGLSQMALRRFDPFAPVWLFLAGYAQVYVVQAISYHDYALRARGADLTAEANLRALWALGWFLLVYYSGIGRMIASRLPRPPRAWSPGLICAIAPPMIVWGLACSGFALRAGGSEEGVVSQEENLLRQFPIMMLVAGILLVVTGRQPSAPRPALTAAGLAVAAAYVMIWMFNGKRSHSLIGVLTTVAAYYLPRGRRPNIAVLAATGLAGAMVVSLALGWRDNYRYERSFAGFFQFVGDFDPESILVNLNVKGRHDDQKDSRDEESYETEEYGGFLLMMHTVPAKAAHDYGASYIRLVSTYIPRLVWPDKPYFGREQWVAAWIAGSAQPRDATFTGPSIGLLGATQLNGGATATAIVLGVLAILLRTGYELFRLYADVPWTQAWWALSYFTAWLMTVNDDPFVWFYYLYGHTTLPPLVFLWFVYKFGARGPS